MSDLKATVHTLGCRLNQSESSIMEKSLEKQGYRIVPFKEESNVAIINTCTVTARADSDCRHVIRNYIKRNPDSFIAVVGCYSQMGYKALSEIEGVDLIMGNQDKLDVVNYVKLGKNDKPLILRDRIGKDDFTAIFVLQFYQTAFGTAIAHGFPLRRSHIGQFDGLPKRLFGHILLLACGRSS